MMFALRQLSSIRLLRPLVAASLYALLAPAVRAENLQEVFDLAANKDPEIRQARARYTAANTQINQGRSFLLPSLTATAAYSRDTSAIAEQHSFGDGFTSKSYGINLQQALVNFQAWYQFQSIKLTEQAAALTLAQQEQGLIVRVATAYFNVLRSQANLASFEAQEAAAQQVLDQTQQRFDVGLATTIDVNDSQAQADLVTVSKLREQNVLNQRKEALQAITGQPVGDLAQLNTNFPIAPVQPANLQDWVAQATEQNLGIRIAALDRDAKEQDIKAAKAAHYPTVNFGIRYGWSRSGNTLDFVPSFARENSSVSLSFTAPIFNGGRATALEHQANANFDASKEGLTKAQRDNIQTTRNAYRSVETDVKAVAAQAKAVVSAQSAYESAQVGAEVGTRNVVEVGQALDRLFRAQRDYAGSRFDYAIDTLTLKQAAGVLSPKDVVDLNQWLSP